MSAAELRVSPPEYADTGAPAPARPGPGERRVELVNMVRWLPRKPGTLPGMGLAAAGLLLVVLAGGMGYVSYVAQYGYVEAVKAQPIAATLEALGLDAAAAVFALLALVLAAQGRPAVIERALNVAAVGGSTVMNALAGDPHTVRALAVWVLPPVLYAATSDRLIAVVRVRIAARTSTDIDIGSPWRSVAAAGACVGLWLLRLVLAPAATLRAFRGWVLADLPAPSRPGVDAHPAGNDVGDHAAADEHGVGLVEAMSRPGTKRRVFLSALTAGPAVSVAEAAAAADLDAGTARRYAGELARRRTRTGAAGEEGSR